VVDISLLLWAVIPPLLFLGYYYRRVPAAPPPLQLLLCFIVGAISGFVALGVEWLVSWQQIQRSLPDTIVRQLVEVAPIEEGCKLLALVAATSYLQRRYRLRATSVFLFNIAIALGFAAEENWIYFYHGAASFVERIIGTPVHALFSAPWGYALAKYIASPTRLNRDRKLIPKAWLNSVICHALANILSSALAYPLPFRFLSYGFFPLLLWLFWRLEQLLRRVQGKRPIRLISGQKFQHRFGQRILLLSALILGGNALFGLFILARKLSPLRPAQLLYPDIFKYLLIQLSLNLIFGILAWLIYRHLRHLAIRQSLNRFSS
jgi:RsiW-degrading membrane proteinase PrsW (M82 family)